jgi:hypothetical protein
MKPILVCINNKNIVVISNNGRQSYFFFLCSKDLTFLSYLNKIVNNSDESISHNDQGLAGEA